MEEKGRAAEAEAKGTRHKAQERANEPEDKGNNRKQGQENDGVWEWGPGKRGTGGERETEEGATGAWAVNQGGRGTRSESERKPFFL